MESDKHQACYYKEDIFFCTLREEDGEFLREEKEWRRVVEVAAREGERM